MKIFEPKPIGKETFLTSWFIGTILFVIFYLSKETILLIIGVYYFLIAIVINFLILFHEFFQACNDLSNSKRYWISCLYILANIPISMIYLNLMFP